MGEQLKKLRKRTPEQEALLQDVRKYLMLVAGSTATRNRVKQMFRNKMIADDDRDKMLLDFVKPIRLAADRSIRQTFKDHHVADMPIWSEWMQHVRGIDKKLGIRFIALIQPISDFDNVAKLWAYAGQAVGDDGRAVRRKRGVQSRWNNSLKSTCYLAGTSFVKARGSAYRDLYDLYRARDKAAHPEPIADPGENGKARKDRDGKPIMLYTNAHMNNRGIRYAAKMFLSHLWQAWRELEGLPTPEPYPIEYLKGHTNLLSPWTCIQKKEEANPASRDGDDDAQTQVHDRV